MFIYFKSQSVLTGSSVATFLTMYRDHETRYKCYAVPDDVQHILRMQRPDGETRRQTFAIFMVLKLSLPADKMFYDWKLL